MHHHRCILCSLCVLQKPEGLIPLLEDVIATSGTDRDWLDRCRGRSQPSDHFTPKAHPAFHIRHYAGQVSPTLAVSSSPDLRSRGLSLTLPVIVQ